jgi:hypothetical protein
LDRRLGGPQFLSRRYGKVKILRERGYFPGGKEEGVVKLITHPHLARRSRKLELYLHSPECFHGIVLN